MDSNGCIAKYKSYHPNFITRSLKINAGMVEIAQIIKNVLELRNSLSLSILLLLFYIAIFIMSFFLQQKRAHLSSSSFVIIVMYNLLFEFFLVVLPYAFLRQTNLYSCPFVPEKRSRHVLGSDHQCKLQTHNLNRRVNHLL